MQRQSELFNVPLSDAGLRMYAANGDWSLVANYAVKLEEAAAEAATDKLTLINGAVASIDETRILIERQNVTNNINTIRVSRETASLASRLPYILVQVTAYFKMQRIAAAKALLDRLGDVESERFAVTVQDNINDSHHKKSMNIYNNKWEVVSTDIDAKESFVPFSLRFIAALIPFYVGVIAESEKRLDFLLVVCERHLSKNNSLPWINVQDAHHDISYDVNIEKWKADKRFTQQMYMQHNRLTWLKRKQRVLRALIYLYFVQKEYAVTILTYKKLIKTFEQEVEITNSLKKVLSSENCNNNNSNSNANNNSNKKYTGNRLESVTHYHSLLRRVMLMQELGCVCLHCGNLAAAQEAFRQIELELTQHEMHYTSIRKEESVLHNCIMTLNNVYVLMFNGAFDVAVDVLQTLVHECALTSQELQSTSLSLVNRERKDETHVLEYKKELQKEEEEEQQQEQQKDMSESNNNNNNEELTNESEYSMHKLTESTLRIIWTNAMNTHITALPYDVRTHVNPLTMMSSIVSLMEQYMQSNPLLFAHNDAFLTNAVRLYTLQGDRAGKLEQLAILLEQYRCEAASIPPLDKMI